MYRPDNGTTRRGEASRRVASSRKIASPIYDSVLFSAFLRVVARVQKCFANIQRFVFGGCPHQIERAEERRGKDGGGKARRPRGWPERRMDEACGTRSPTRPSGNSTRSSTHHPLLSHGIHTIASAAGCEGEENPALIAAGRVDW